MSEAPTLEHRIRELPRPPLWSYALLFRPRHVQARLEVLHEAGALSGPAPSLWQVFLGTLYMWHRVTFRPQTIGLSSSPVRDTRRARLLRNRLFRGPLLFTGRRVNPLDHTGLGSSSAHLVRHLIGAHHDRQDYVYDLEILATDPGQMAALEQRLAGIVSGEAPDAAFLRDLCVYEGYHESLLDTVRRWNRGELPDLSTDNPDVTLRAFMAWCARQPPTPGASLRALLRRQQPAEVSP